MLAYILVGLVCGFIDSSLGMGFGVTSSTILITYGIAPAIASASVHAAESIIDILSAIVHRRMGNVDWKLVWKIAIPGVIAAILGASILSWLTLGIAQPLIRIILATMGFIVFYRHAFKYEINPKLNDNHALIIGFTAGFLDTLGGGGWGPIGTPSLILSGSEPRKAVGTIEFTEPFVSLAAVITFGLTLGFEQFLWNMTIPMIIGGLILTPIAGWVTSKLPYRWLGAFIGVWLMVINIYGLLV